MGLAIQKELLSRFIQKMCDNGMVNDQFVKLQELKKPNTPEFVVRAVTLYCMAVKNLFFLLSNMINETEVNFYEVALQACDLYERSRIAGVPRVRVPGLNKAGAIDIGAEHVKIASIDILRSCQAFDKNGCIQALNQTKKEFSNLRRNLETLVQVYMMVKF
ncbi:hypothetical protein HYC85_029164 [Camellia sinensis]|uniref:Histidine-containing phosphotransfer protein n=1 Tax=Camellia sinensis TaxID=4442 RepID=A0A7J7FX78_CAMSI|nr:hypothetical protein HYC85_029164 [Camellia sinensis]